MQPPPHQRLGSDPLRRAYPRSSTLTLRLVQTLAHTFTLSMCLGAALFTHPAAAAPPAKAAPAANVTPAAARAKPAAKKPGKSASQRVIFKHLRHLILDPGHGGSNKGAIGYRASREKHLTLELSNLFRAYLQAHSNLKVTLTRHGDVDLALRDRPRLANRLRGDALISVHCNASVNPKIHGMEVWFLTADTSMKIIHDIVRREEGLPETGPEAVRQWTAHGVVETLRHAEAHRASQAFAIALRKGLIKARPRVRFRGIKQDAFGVLKEARMPAVVLEVGYITHPVESLQLMQRSQQEALARGVLLGLVELDRQLGVLRAGRPGQAVRPAKAAVRPVIRPKSAAPPR